MTLENHPLEWTHPSATHYGPTTRPPQHWYQHRSFSDMMMDMDENPHESIGDSNIPRKYRPTVGRYMWSATMGLLAFLASWAIGIGLTGLLIRAIPPAVPHPTEAYEGFGDAMLATFWFLIGTVLSFFVAVIIGGWTASTAPTPRFSLRTMFVVTALVAVAAALFRACIVFGFEPE